MFFFFFFNDTATTDIYPLSLTTLFRSVVISAEDLSASVCRWFRGGGGWRVGRVITIPAEPADPDLLPPALKPFQNKLFGLTIDPERLAAIRQESAVNTRYASMRPCRLEVGEVEALFRTHQIRYLNSTNYSVEEIATKNHDIMGLARRMY